MNKKTKKIIIIVSILLVVYLFIPFFRNPLSDMITRMQVKNYLEENYAGMGYEIESFGFNGLDSYYRYTVSIPGSKDKRFDIRLGRYGGVYLDTYDTDVSLNFNTSERMWDEYFRLVEGAVDINDIISGEEYGSVSGFMEFASKEEYGKYDDIPEYAYFYEDLVPEKEYDVKEMGTNHAQIFVSINHVEDLSYKRAAEVLLWVKEELDRAGIGFYCVYVSLFSPPSGPYGEAQYMDPYIAVKDMPYDEIYEEGLAERVKANYIAYLESTGDVQTYFGEE